MKLMVLKITIITLMISAANALTLEKNDNNTYVVSDESTQNNVVVSSGKMNLIDIAGKQRMLSQRIVKDYLYKGNKVAVGKATKQLQVSLGEFLNGHKTLLASINDPEIKNLLAFVEMSSNDFKDIVNKPFILDNA